MKDVGNDPDAEMTASVTGTRVPSMKVRLVDHLESIRIEGLAQAGLDGLDALGRHGRTCLNGTTSAPDQAPDWM